MASQESDRQDEAEAFLKSFGSLGPSRGGTGGWQDEAHTFLNARP
jgi:hypothetical protein